MDEGKAGIEISVILPVYNAEKYLPACLDSVIGQDLESLEILCINDGSTDASEAILRDYARRDARIRIITQENEGAAKARNLGIREAIGQFVAFMDADDFYPGEGVLSRLYEAAKKYHTMVAGGSFSEIDSTGVVHKGKNHYEGRFAGFCFEKEECIRYEDYQFDYGFTRFIYTRQLLLDQAIFFPELSFYEDPPFFVRAMSAAGQFAAIPEVVYVYRVGIKNPIWDAKQTVDLLEGLLTNLGFAKAKGYERLYAMTMEQMMVDYRYPLEMHGRIAEELDRLARANRSLFDGTKPYRALLDMVTVCRGREIDSISYKVGCAVTFLPRRVFHLIFERN